MVWRREQRVWETHEASKHKDEPEILMETPNLEQHIN